MRKDEKILLDFMREHDITASEALQAIRKDAEGTVEWLKTKNPPGDEREIAEQEKIIRDADEILYHGELD